MSFFNRLSPAAGLCAVLALAGCATSKPPQVAPPAPTPPAAAAPSDGGYKVGNPYQIEGKWYYPAEDYSYRQEGIASWYGADFHGKKTANGERYDMNGVSAAHPTLPLPSMVKVTNLDNGRVLKVRINDRGPFHGNRIIDLSRRAAQLLGFYEAGTARVRVEIDTPESIVLKNMAMRDHPPEMPKLAAVPRGAVAAAPLAPVGATSADLGQKPAQPPPPRKNVATATPTPQKPPKTPARAVPSAGDGSGIFIQAGAFAEMANAKRLEKQLKEFGSVFVIPVTVDNAQLYRVRLGPVGDDAVAEELLAKIRAMGHDDAQIVRF
jgi:rare lipoprotein A